MLILGNLALREKISQLILDKKKEGVFLFYGPEGVGKFTFAKVLAQNFDPHDRLIFENGILIDDLRKDIKNFLMTKPLYDRKIIIINDFQKTNVVTQQAFLKTLEEPQVKSVIILISSNLSSVLKTIQSRAQVFRFHLVDRGEIKIFFKNQGYDEKNLETALFIYPHQPGLVKKILESNFLEFINKFSNTRNIENIKKIIDAKEDDQEESGEKFKTLLIYLIQKEREKIKEQFNLKSFPDIKSYQRLNFLTNLYYLTQYYSLNLKIQLFNLFLQYYD